MISFVLQVIFLGKFAKHTIRLSNGLWIIRAIVAAVFCANISIFFFTFFRETKVRTKYGVHSSAVTILLVSCVASNLILASIIPIPIFRFSLDDFRFSDSKISIIPI